MSSVRASRNKVYLVLAILLAAYSIILTGVVIEGVSHQGEVDRYQAALSVNNWTNQTLNITVFVYGGDWTELNVPLEHGANITLILTWTDNDQTVLFIHSEGLGVHNTQMYSIEPGQWRSVLLI